MSEMSESKRFPVRRIAARDVWEVDCRPYGRIRSVLFPGSTTPIKVATREMANEIRRVILSDIASGVPERAAVAPYLPRESLVGAVLERWLAHLARQVENGERSPNYTRRLRDFAGPDGHLSPLFRASIHSLDYGQLEDFAYELQDSMGATSIVHCMSALRTALRWHAKRSGGTFVAPEFPELKRADFEPVILTPEQQDKVLEQIPIGQRGAFIALVDLMIRPSEARAVTIGDYSFDSREVWVTTAKKGEGKDAPVGATKGRDRRHLLVTARLASWIETHTPKRARIDPSRPLFENPDARGGDRRWAYGSMRDAWASAVERAEVPDAPLYSGTKHSTSTWLRSAGLSLDEIGLALGHTWATREKKVTEGYARAPRLANANIARILDGRRA